MFSKYIDKKYNLSKEAKLMFIVNLLCCRSIIVLIPYHNVKITFLF